MPSAETVLILSGQNEPLTLFDEGGEYVKKRRFKWFTSFQQLKGFKFYHIIIYFLLSIVMFGLMYSNVKPEEINVTLFSHAEKTIVAPHNFEDREATEMLRREAADNVEDQYRHDREKAIQQAERVHKIFDTVEEVQKEIEALEKVPEITTPEETEGITETEEETETPQPLEKTDEEKLSLLKENLNGQVTEDWKSIITDEEYSVLLSMSDSDLSSLRNATVTAINNAMSKKIRLENDVEEAKNNAVQELQINANFPTNIRNIGITLTKLAIIPNVIYDSELTQDLRMQ
jgi:membrane-associated HD superfamily phosphohydrolase